MAETQYDIGFSSNGSRLAENVKPWSKPCLREVAPVVHGPDPYDDANLFVSKFRSVLTRCAGNDAVTRARVLFCSADGITLDHYHLIIETESNGAEGSTEPKCARIYPDPKKFEARFGTKGRFKDPDTAEVSYSLEYVDAGFDQVTGGILNFSWLISLAKEELAPLLASGSIDPFDQYGELVYFLSERFISAFYCQTDLDSAVPIQRSLWGTPPLEPSYERHGMPVPKLTTGDTKQPASSRLDRAALLSQFQAFLTRRGVNDMEPVLALFKAFADAYLADLDALQSLRDDLNPKPIKPAKAFQGRNETRSPLQFLHQEYAEELANRRLTAPILKKLDAKLYAAVASELSRKGSSLSSELPTKSEVLDRRAELASIALNSESVKAIHAFFHSLRYTR